MIKAGDDLTLHRRELMSLIAALSLAAVAGPSAFAADAKGAWGARNARDLLVSGQAWDEFCDTLKTAAKVVDRFGNDIDDHDRAEWYRFLTRCMRWGFERFVENSDAARPLLMPFPWRVTINVTTPDQDHYFFDYFDTAKDYVIAGNRGTTPYFVIAVLTQMRPTDFATRNWAAAGIDGLKEYDQAIEKTTHFLSSDQMTFAPNGDFEIQVSRHKKQGNWLQLDPDSTWILVRAVHHERAKEISPTFKISPAKPVAPSRATPEQMTAALVETGQLVLGYANLLRLWWQDDLGQRLNRLRFSKSLYLTNGGVNDREFAFGAWKKSRDEALVFQFTPPEADYWILQMCNIWQENLDNYEEGRGRLNKFMAKAELDGSILAVFADQDPGMGGNWIDSGGWTKGIMGLRFIRTKGAPEVKSYLVPLKELRRKGRKLLTPDNAIASGETTE